MIRQEMRNNVLIYIKKIHDENNIKILKHLLKKVSNKLQFYGHMNNVQNVSIEECTYLL